MLRGAGAENPQVSPFGAVVHALSGLSLSWRNRLFFVCLGCLWRICDRLDERAHYGPLSVV